MKCRIFIYCFHHKLHFRRLKIFFLHNCYKISIGCVIFITSSFSTGRHSVIDTTAKKYFNYVKNETSQLLNIILCGKKTTFSSIITHSWRKIPYTSTWIVLPSFFHAYIRLRYTFFFFFEYNIIYNSVIAIRQ